MWHKAFKKITFSGTVAVSLGSSSPALPLRGVLVDVYSVERAADGKYHFTRLNHSAALTSSSGDFSFTDLPVTVEAKMVTSANPPYTPVEFVKPTSLPTLVFRISADAEVLSVTSAVEGTEIVEIHDERPLVDAAWIAAHSDRVQIALTGNPPIAIVVPEGDPEAMAIAGLSTLPASFAEQEFHFLRIGRVIREEIGDIGDLRADFANRAGYMKSSNLQTPATSSFFPDVLDAPFGGTVHIGGRFGTPFDSTDLYYSLSFWKYAGNLANPFDATQLTAETRVEDPLFNKKYISATNQWQTLALGPFDGTVTDVEPPLSPASIGSSVRVYKRPIPAAGEYWPFEDLVAIWNSGEAPDETIVFTIEAYERVGGTETNPNLRKRFLGTPVSGYEHLALTIDNRVPVLKLFDWRTGVARFATDDVVATAPFDPCSEMPVVTPQPDRNECIVVKYSIEDGSGNPHPHVSWYTLGVQYTPKQVGGAPLEAGLSLRNFLGGGTYDKLSDSYSPSIASAPAFNIVNRESVLVPTDIDGWPPETNGDPTSAGSQCLQYALEAGATCAVRTVDGWSAAFGHPSLGRHIIVRRA